MNITKWKIFAAIAATFFCVASVQPSVAQPSVAPAATPTAPAALTPASAPVAVTPIDKPAEISSSSVLATLLLCGLMGLLGQGVRAAVGLKSSMGASGTAANQQTEFNAAYFFLSLMIGFIAGVLAGLVIGLDKLVRVNPMDIKILLGIAASGYAGADFIENTFSIVIPGSADKSSGTAQSSGTNVAAAINTALAPHLIGLHDSVSALNSAAVSLKTTANGPALTATSPSELQRDMAEASKYLAAIQKAAQQCSLAPSLICAIGSRESNWGQGSDMHPKGPAGTGDWARRDPAKWNYPMPPDGLGWGRGLMQVDYAQSDFGKTGDWQDPAANVLFGAQELSGNIDYFKKHPHGNVDPLRAAIAAYNCGRGNVNRAITGNHDVDAFTTGHNYSLDVTARAAWFKANGFDDLPPAA